LELILQLLAGGEAFWRIRDGRQCGMVGQSPPPQSVASIETPRDRAL